MRLPRVVLVTLAALAGSSLGCAAADQSAKLSRSDEPGIVMCTVTIDRRPVSVRNADITSGVQRATAYVPTQLSGQNLTKEEVRALAEAVGLLQETETNPHLAFLGGDIAYWSEQAISLDRLRMEFAARKAVLDAANRDKVIIDDQGKLSWAAQEIMAHVLKEKARQKQNKGNKETKP